MGKDGGDVLQPLLVVTPLEENPVAPSGWRGIWFFVRLCSWWFAYSAMMGPLPSAIWPAQIESIVGAKNKEKYNGFVPAFGAAVSLVITPIAGMMSDRSYARIGRRKIYLIVGSLIAVVFFVLCSTVQLYGSAKATIWTFVAYTIGLQFGINLAAGPYAGLIPDMVHPSQVGRASGYNGLGAALGYLVGFGATAVFSTDDIWQVYTFLAGFFMIFTLPTLLGVKEPVRKGHAEPITILAFFKSLYLDPKHYKSFYWVLLTRFLEQMGVYSVLPFFQYFIQDVVTKDEPEDSKKHELFTSLILGTIVLVSIPSSIIGGILSDRFGRKRSVIVSMAIMSCGVGINIVLCFYPYIQAMFGGACVFGIGYGAFLAVDWALALDSLPEGADIAKDMGIWHISFVLPQVLAPIITGQILDNLKHSSITRAYTVVFSLACCWFALATIFVFPIRLKSRTIKQQENEWTPPNKQEN